MRQHPKALPHGELKEVFKDVFFLTGTVAMPGPLPITFSRNMTVVREGGNLTLINSIRLGEGGGLFVDAAIFFDARGEADHFAEAVDDDELPVRVAGHHHMEAV